MNSASGPFAAVALLATLLAHGSAVAQTISNLQSIPVFFTCLAQDRELADDFWANNQAPKENAEQTRKRLEPAMTTSSWAVCAQRTQWVPKAFCRDVLNAYKAERGLDLRPVMSKHEDERQQLKAMYDYFEAAFPKGGVERPDAPDCPA